jgi:hypothetical protein
MKTTIDCQWSGINLFPASQSTLKLPDQKLLENKKRPSSLRSCICARINDKKYVPQKPGADFSYIFFGENFGENSAENFPTKNVGEKMEFSAEKKF